MHLLMSQTRYRGAQGAAIVIISFQMGTLRHEQVDRSQ